MDQGQILKEDGMAAALHSADRALPRWTDQAMACLNEYARGQYRFTSDGFREKYKDVLPDPPSFNCFGALFNKAARDGVIVQVGYVKSRRASAHKRVVGLWQAAA